MTPMTRNLRTFVRSGLVSVLIFAGFWLYTRWDLQQFEETLPKAPQAQKETQQNAPARDVPSLAKEMETLGPHTGVEPSDRVALPPADGRAIAVYAPDATETHSHSLEGSLEESTLGVASLEETPAEAITSGDVIPSTLDAPYDLAFVEKGFHDYNASLDTDPEYAYKRLGDALREQLNDERAVSRLIKTVRKSNNGSLTLKEGVENTTFLMDILSKTSPPEAMEGVEDHFRTLRELQALELESGTYVSYDVQFVFGE